MRPASSSGLILALLQILAAINLNEGMQTNIIWPFLPEGDSRIGLYAGIMASSFHVAQFLTAALWGRISDKFGRRPALLAGLCGSAFAVLMFGLAFNYWATVFFRFLSGVLSGNVAITKVPACAAPHGPFVFSHDSPV